jgi:hypothetical protein
MNRLGVEARTAAEAHGTLYAPTMSGRLPRPTRYLWLSIAVGLVAASIALPSFTDPWPSNVGGFVFVVVVVAAVVRGTIALGRGFREGWQEPRPPVPR